MDFSFQIAEAKPTDAAAMLHIYAPFVRETSINFDVEVPDLDQFSKRIENYLRQYPWLLARQGETVVGYAYASQYRERVAYQWSCECSVYIEPALCKKRDCSRTISKAIRDLKIPGLQKCVCGN